MSRRNQKGMSLVEATIILTVIAILSAILAPSIGQFVRRARVTKAREDVQMLASAIIRFLDDTGESAFYDNGREGDITPKRDTDDVVGVLVGDGDVPDLPGGAFVAGDGLFTNPASAVDNWRLASTSTFTVTTSVAPGASLTMKVDTFANQLITNTPEGSTTSRYRTGADLSNGSNSSGIAGGFQAQSRANFNFEYAWRGPYLTEQGPDPWGNRYAANVGFLYAPQSGATASGAGDGFREAVFVISAGPDEEIETAFTQSALTIGDDDIIAVVSGGSLMR